MQMILLNIICRFLLNDEESVVSLRIVTTFTEHLDDRQAVYHPPTYLVH